MLKELDDISHIITALLEENKALSVVIKIKNILAAKRPSRQRSRKFRTKNGKNRLNGRIRRKLKAQRETEEIRVE